MWTSAKPMSMTALKTPTALIPKERTNAAANTVTMGMVKLAKVRIVA